jgi:hypothetical protein
VGGGDIEKISLSGLPSFFNAVHWKIIREIMNIVCPFLNILNQDTIEPVMTR